MKNLCYTVLDPSGNVTLLADRPEEASPAALAALAARLLKKEKTAEQAGYVSGFDTDRPGLYMAGGEFCGNASMAAAALYARHRGLRTAELFLQVSGAGEPVLLQLEEEEGAYRCRVRMPRAASVTPVSLSLGERTLSGQLVRYPGICHLVTEEAQEKDAAEAAVRRWCGELAAEGLGLQFYEKKTGRLTPLVYIPGIPSLVWESSCASGTAALGEVLLRRNGPFSETEIRESGGTLGLSADREGRIWLRGRVRITGEGRLRQEEYHANHSCQ